MSLEVTERGRSHVKKAIPFFSWYGPLDGLAPVIGPHRTTPRLAGALLLIHDSTDAMRKERQLKVKSAMIQEVHHRVKNSLQNIASLLRMQSRRSGSAEVQDALQEAVSRILSVAVVHEFLAHQEARTINIKEVAQRIIQQVQSVVVDPSIHFAVEGPAVYLPTQQATSCAIVINELLQNAMEHAFNGTSGTVNVRLEDHGDRVSVSVEDDGQGLPEGFQRNGSDSLGLRIVETLVQEDLKGSFALNRRNDAGSVAVASFPKTTAGGTEPWSEQE
jgi:two-component sensor histidine kinase